MMKALLLERVLQGAHDVLRPHTATAAGVSRWTDRVFFVDGGVEYPLSSVWPRGGPWWVQLTIGLTRMLGSAPMRPLYRLTLAPDQAAS